jgi:hypothetical protein
MQSFSNKVSSVGANGETDLTIHVSDVFFYLRWQIKHRRKGNFSKSRLCAAGLAPNFNSGVKEL